MNFERGKDSYKSLQIGSLTILWNTLIEIYLVDPTLFKPILTKKHNGRNILIIKQISGWNIEYMEKTYLGVIFKDKYSGYLETAWAVNKEDAEKLAKDIAENYHP